MITLGLLVRLEARPGREDALAALLEAGAPVVADEPETLVWYAVRTGPATFAIFDAFADEAGRDAHLAGALAAALMAKAPELLAQPPIIDRVDVLAHHHG